MQAFEVVTQKGLTDVAQRVLRLLATYRIVASLGAFVLIAVDGNTAPMRTALLVFVALYSLFAVFQQQIAHQVWNRPRLWLTMFILADIAFVCAFSLAAGTLLFTAALVPILVAHGWLLRDRLALAHAAMVALTFFVLLFVSLVTATEAAFVGAGSFAAASLGIVLGRVGIEAIALADQRGMDLEKLSALNQRIIDDLDQGVLVIDRDGNILQANPQAERWIFGESVGVQYPQQVMTVAQPLGIQWANWREGHPMIDGIAITLGSDESQVKVRARFVSAQLRRMGDAVVFLDDLALAQTRAQQLKLAALGRLTANIAHEIRNPLSAIRQASQLMSEDAAPEQRRLTEMVEKNVRRIDRIVVNVLSLSKRDRIIPQTVPVTPALAELVSEWREQAEIPERGVALNIEPQLQMRIDKGHLEEVLWNLLSNGWRHSQKKDASVRLDARRSASGRMVVLDITDDGAGVPDEHRESIFEPFFSLSGSSGLGLFISRELIESNGGTLELAQHAPGAQFHLLIPSAGPEIQSPPP